MRPGRPASPEHAPAADAGQGQVRPIAAELCAILAEHLRGTLVLAAAQHWHRTRYHGLRSPVYLVAALAWAIAGCSGLCWECAALVAAARTAPAARFEGGQRCRLQGVDARCTRPGRTRAGSAGIVVALGVAALGGRLPGAG